MDRAKNKYSKLLKTLYSKVGSQDRELRTEHVKRLCNKFDIKLNSPRIIHVTGTNGKGSVVYKCSRVLTNYGFKTGLFTSPHISWVRERILVDDK